jgi:hypothetical protein
MNILELIEELEGAGLIVTDEEEVKEELIRLGIDLTAEVAFPDNDDSDDDSDNDLS